MMQAARRLRTAFLALLAATVTGALVFSGAAQETQSPISKARARQRAEEILAAAVDAAGGAALNKIESVELNFRIRGSGDLTFDSDLRLWLAYPSRWRAEQCVVQTSIKGGSGTVTSSRSGLPTLSRGPITPMHQEERCEFMYASGYDGTTAWTKRENVVTTETLGEGKPTSDFFGALIIYRWASEDKLPARFIGIETLNGRELLALEVELPAAKLNPFAEAGIQPLDHVVRLYADRETSLLAGIRFRELTAAGPVDVIQNWKDYRRVRFESGDREFYIQFPFTWTSQTGSRNAAARITKLKLNAPTNPRLFERPK